jgi:multidrug efflux pump subunit AcrB
MKVKDYSVRESVETEVRHSIRSKYSGALVDIEAQQNIFEKIFSASETPLIAQVSRLKEKEVPPVEQMTGIIEKMQERYPDAGISPPRLEDKILLKLVPGNLLLYDLDPATVYNGLKTSLNQNNIGDLRASYELLPIVLSGREKKISEIINTGSLINRSGEAVPITSVVEVRRVHDYKSIRGGANGEYVPVNMSVSTNKPAALTSEIRDMLQTDPDIGVQFSGSLITGQKLFKELTIILIVALLLLYFILSAQFESLTQPLIVLLEIPIDIAGALLLVHLLGGTINIMTMIGLIVMSGVIINDSILKVDTINNLRAEGLTLKEAIYTGGSRRLKPIIMVAMASIISTMPILFSQGIGSELQRPMALALIGGMSLGTVVSLFFIPLAYWFIYRKAG